jgi:N4-gp56 family major capsid protein
MPNTTRTNNDIPREVNNFYDTTLLTRLLPLLQYLRYAQIRDIPRNSGTNTIKFRRYNSLNPALVPLVEGVTPQGQKLSVTDVIARVKQYGRHNCRIKMFFEKLETLTVA